MKYLMIESNGYAWHVPLIKIAEHRANHYTNDPDTTIQDEIDYVMDDDYEGRDWYGANMNWVDVAQFAVLVQTPEPLTEPEDDADTSIVEIDDGDAS